ncbi:MAG: hypothetical protein ACFFA0_03740 [Promethearchaeota archaeon]
MSNDFEVFKQIMSRPQKPEQPKKPSKPDNKPKRLATPKINKNELKNELRQLIDTIGSGHKKYTLLGYENILQVKARIWQIIDSL